MRRTLVLLLALPLADCTCYARPLVRNVNAIGAPSVRVGPTGLDSAPPWGFREPTPSKFATSGMATDISQKTITIKPRSGASVRIGIDHLTLIDQDGRHVNWMAVPEGAKVRASWNETKAGPVAQTIDVLETHPTH